MYTWESCNFAQCKLSGAFILEKKQIMNSLKHFPHSFRSKIKENIYEKFINNSEEIYLIFYLLRWKMQVNIRRFKNISEKFN